MHDAVELTGQLVCASGDDGRTWQVDEVFDGPEAFRAHQVRVAASACGRATAHLERRYEVTGLPAGESLDR